jgi:hypothetical protein
MKKSIILSLTVALFIITACNNNNKQSDANTSGSKKADIRTCYLAVSNADSATLSIHKENAKTVGKLAFNFSKKDDTDGSVSGEFKGDTLFVEYAFKYKGTKYSNPQVFLMKGDSLIQGHGDLRTMLGRTYFEDHSKIMFDGFVFKPSDCK